MVKVLLSNDDGVRADGIIALQNELSSKYQVTTVAPLEERSTTGHSVSLDKPLRIEKMSENIYGCSGFPGDCVLVALGHLMKKNRPDVVVSGINRGANLGQDLYYSGTVAAAREAAFHQVPSIAMSLVLKSALGEQHYKSAAMVADWLIENKIYECIPKLSLINVNVPNLPLNEIKGMKVTEIGFRQYSDEVNERIDSRGRPYYWIVGLLQGHYPNPKSDCIAVEEGYIAVTIHSLVSHVSVDDKTVRTIVDRINEKYF